MREEIFRAYNEAKIDDDSIVFFRVNNYYVALFDDAKRVSNELHIPLLTKNIDDSDIIYIVIQEDNLVSVLMRLDRCTEGNYKLIETVEFIL